MVKFEEKGFMKSGGPHRDYIYNLEMAENFIKKVIPHLLRGMTVRVADGEHIPKALLMIAWTPPKLEKRGNYATPISLHDENSVVRKKMETIFNVYYKIAKESLDKDQFLLGGEL